MLAGLIAGLAACALPAVASREFPVGRPARLDELPATARVRTELERLPPAARARGLQWLQGFHFTDGDLPSLRADAGGGIYYVCDPGPAMVATAPAPVVATAVVPISPFPSNLVFHSRPGSPNILYLNFAGETVKSTEWNTSLARTTIPAVAFNTDADLTTFSDDEQTAIKRIWERVSEDYSPFDVDVTTERPATFTTRTAHALITRSTDANGEPNPSSTAGGVAYVNVFGTSYYAQYRPAWIYYNNLSSTESYIAEAASHEIGHNMGLSHDGKTDGTEYYLGHGTGDISWAPIMGAGYYRQVTQWSKGEYYLANNSEDDLAILAGKLTYSADDHAGTPFSATPLVFTQGTNVVSTTPETDPANTNAANKGVLEHDTDADMFSFITGSGPVRLSVTPLVLPAGMHGGNADIVLELSDDLGATLLVTNPPSLTTALIDTRLTAGRYYLRVSTTGAGDPLASPPIGYVSYGSVGRYFINGSITDVGSYRAPPLAELTVVDLTQTDQATKPLSVTYAAEVAVDVSTIGPGDIRVLGPNGYQQIAPFESLDTPGNGTPRTATYAVTPPTGGVWSAADNGTYVVWMQTNQVRDTEGSWVRGMRLGQFLVNVPRRLYSANMTADPGWTLEPQWAYGTPSYGSSGPSGGFTGTKIIAYNLSGNYPNNLAVKYATAPLIDCSASESLTLRFARWLRLRSSDTASIEVSTNGTTWMPVWSTTRTVSDTGWQVIQYTLPDGVAGCPTVRLRWGLASNISLNDIGWNLDDVELLGDVSLDTTPPLPHLGVADVTQSGSPNHACTVTYTDDTAVRLASLDSSDLLVTGPNGYSNLVEFAGANLSTDGAPMTASYSIPAPHETWGVADNGLYTVTLLGDAVGDPLNNLTPETVLGQFSVAILTWDLGVTVNNPAWGRVSPTGGTYEANTAVELLATPETYYRFDRWSGAAAGTSNPLTLLLTSNLAVQAVFAEITTTNYATPLAWLAGYGFTTGFEAAAEQVGANGMAFWQSYVAGLDPTNPVSRLTLSARFLQQDQACVLSWDPVPDRLYTVWSATNLLEGFTPLSGAVNLPAATPAITNPLNPAIPLTFYRLGVERPAATNTP